jgi:hypothetical protein
LIKVYWKNTIETQHNLILTLQEDCVQVVVVVAAPNASNAHTADGGS